MNLKILKRNLNTNTKSIYKSFNLSVDTNKISDIIQFGYPDSSHYLKMKANLNMVHHSNSKVREIIHSLKVTASHNKFYSLSATQIKSSLPIFVIYNDLSSHKWLEKPDSRKKLDSKNYEVCINPRILNISEIYHYEFEECGSIRFLKAKVKRPLSILATYINEKGEKCEAEFYDFEARVFCHEYDHLLGKTILNWNNSKGDIILDGEEKFDRSLKKDEENDKFEYNNFLYTFEHYKNRILNRKEIMPTIFERFDVQLLNKEYDIFAEEQLSIQNELRGKENFTLEDLMWLDLERAIRKDKKIKIKRKENSSLDNLDNHMLY